MSMVSFSLFRDAIEDGRKGHTIRFRKKPPKVGSLLHLWWKSRTIERAFIGTARCTAVNQIAIDGITKTSTLDGAAMLPWEIDALAIADGFPDTEAFWAFFEGVQDVGWLIHWDPDHITLVQLRPEVVAQWNIEVGDLRNSPHAKLSEADFGWLQANPCEDCWRGRTKIDRCPVIQGVRQDGQSKFIRTHEDVHICTAWRPRD
jgi:hypothetical protein